MARGIVFAAAATAFSLNINFPALAAPIDDPGLQSIGLDASEAKPIGDAEMGGMRGRFVSADGQQIQYFGLVVASNIQNQDGTILSAGAALAVNLKSATPKVLTNVTWATQQGPGVSDTGSGNPGGSTPLSGIGGGVGQVLQITGQGNQGLNQASIDMTTSTPGSLLPNGVPSGTPCGSACQASISSNAVQVLVNAGQGSAAQNIGPQVIFQGIKLNGDLMQASNTMNMIIQLGPPPSVNTAGLSTVLQSVPLLAH